MTSALIVALNFPRETRTERCTSLAEMIEGAMADVVYDADLGTFKTIKVCDDVLPPPMLPTLPPALA
jgi:hypothetical protein